MHAEEVQAIRAIVDDHLIETAARDLLAVAQARIDDLTTALTSERQAAASLREQLTAALQRPPRRACCPANKP